MMFRKLKLYLFILLLGQFSYLSGCMPTKSGAKKSALCKGRSVFSSRSQSCISQSAAPGATLNNVSIDEDSGDNIITLTYQDANGDSADSCQIVENENDFEIRSTQFYKVKTEMLIVYAQAEVVTNAMPTGANKTSAQGFLTIASGHLATITDATNQTSLYGALTNFSSEITNIGLEAQKVTGDTTVINYGKNLITMINNNSGLISSIDKRCYCLAGYCQAVIIPSKDATGNYTFSYKVNESVDGESALQTVSLTINPINDPAVPRNKHISGGLESTTDTGTPIIVTLDAAYDVENNASTLFTYEIVTAPSNGTLSDCGLDGGLLSDKTDIDCVYTPSNGDGADTGTSSSVVIQDITFSSVAKASSEDAITVEFLKKTSNSDDIDIVVSGTSIKIYIIDGTSTASEVITAVNANYEAATLVTASLSGVGINAQNITASPFGLIGGDDSYDYFVYRVHDGTEYSTYNATVTIDIIQTPDPPVARSSDARVFVGSTESSTLEFNEDTLTKIKVGYYDGDGDLPQAVGCTLSNISANLLVTKACSCIASDCFVYVAGVNNYTGAVSFDYNITNSTPETTNTETLNFTINSVVDTPFAKPLQFTANESANSLPDTYSVVIDDPIDGDSGTSYTYTTTTGTLTNGVLSNCMGLNGSLSSDKDCSYIPSDGNLAGTGGLATLDLGTGGGTLRLIAKASGLLGNNIQIKLEKSEMIQAGSEYVEVSTSGVNTIITVFISDGDDSTIANIRDAINAHAKAQFLVIASEFASGSQTATEGPTSLATGTDGLDRFSYTLSDGTNSWTSYASINITDINDPPSVCVFSSYTEAPECGYGDCVSTNSPVGRITPSKTSIYYYDESSAICYKSNGTATSSDWEVVNNEIPDKTVGQGTSVIYTRMRIDEGGSIENTQFLNLDSVTSSNGVLFPVTDNNIVISYNGNVLANTGAAFNDGATSTNQLPFKLELYPQAGITGSSDIAITISDDQGSTSIFTFKVVVDDASVIHRGWKNLSAVGPIINKFDDIIDGNKICKYHIDKCDTGSGSGNLCIGTVAPSGSVTPSANGVVYYRSDTKECYYSTGTTNTDWSILSIDCPVTTTAEEANCSGAGESCLFDDTPAMKNITATQFNSFYYDYTNSKCYRSTGITDDTEWEEYEAPGSVTLSWESFTVLGSGTFKGYNVFRRLAGETFDYENPINQTLLSTSTTNFTDDATTSLNPPIPSTVYYYEVRAVVENGSPTVEFAVGENIPYSVVRILVPPNNKSFAHRWMINKSQCEKMHATVIDGTNNFRCEYIGPGDIDDGGTKYYDIETDLIVDRFEAGCRYNYASEAINCGGSTFDGSCIGIQDPTTASVTPTAANAIYYQRGSGQCWKYDGAAWNKITTYMANYDKAELPPISLISQANSKVFCDAVSETSIMGLCEFTAANCNGATNDCTDTATGSSDPEGAVTGTIGDIFFSKELGKCYRNLAGTDTWQVISSQGTLTARLPNKKHQIAYSDWDTSTLNDSSISTLETGTSINLSSKCNSNDGNGYESYFTDTESPSVNALFTLPGTASSGIKSFMTGSSLTRECQSRYGVQDAVGNVAEWTTDTLDCDEDADGKRCIGASIEGDTIMIPNGRAVGLVPLDYLTYSYDVFRIGYSNEPFLIGACDTDNGTSCTNFTDSWILGTAGPDASARRFIMPLGLPTATSLTVANFPNETVVPYLLEIGSGLGITSSQLHGDKVDFNTTGITENDPAQCGAMSTGGSYNSAGNAAGVYSLEMTPCADTSGADDTIRSDIGFRCIIPVQNALYLE